MKPLVILTLLLLSFVSNAQEIDDQTVMEIPQGWAISLQLGTASLNSELSSQGLGDSATNFGFSFDYLDQDWYSSILIDIVEFDDNYGFSQGVTSSYGGNSTEDSVASATSLAGAIGKAWFVNNNKAMFYAQGGLNLMLEASRAISQCSNCYEEDLDVSGGVFTRVGVNVFVDNFILGVYSSFALSGDIENMFGIRVGIQY
jgi:hypothetical protein